MPFFRRSWVEIDTAAIVNNYKICSRLPAFANGCEAMCVVKANAYGHGTAEVSTALQNAGCKHFAVATVDEAVRLRKSGITGQILILGYTPPCAAEELLRYDLTQTLLSEEYASSIAGKGIKAHFAIDTGMNRIGLDADKPKLCEDIIRKQAQNFNLTGIFTHLCVADTAEEELFTQQQIDKFKAVAKSVADLKLPYIHCLNSAGTLWHKPFGTLARLGIILYGLKPDYANVLPCGIRPALVWKSVVSMIKIVHDSDSIGYGRSFTAPREMRVATIPTGYADGYSRALSNRGCVLIHGQKAPIVGRICMDQFMVDVTDLPNVRAEDEVTLLGDSYTADDMAHTAGSIGYEIVCSISPRVARNYTCSLLK